MRSPARDQHRACRMVHALLADRPQQQSDEPAESVGAYDEQRRAPRRRTLPSVSIDDEASPATTAATSACEVRTGPYTETTWSRADRQRASLAASLSATRECCEPSTPTTTTPAMSSPSTPSRHIRTRPETAVARRSQSTERCRCVSLTGSVRCRATPSRPTSASCRRASTPTGSTWGSSPTSPVDSRAHCR